MLCERKARQITCNQLKQSLMYPSNMNDLWLTQCFTDWWLLITFHGFLTLTTTWYYRNSVPQVSRFTTHTHTHKTFFFSHFVSTFALIVWATKWKFLFPFKCHEISSSYLLWYWMKNSHPVYIYLFFFFDFWLCVRPSLLLLS